MKNINKFVVVCKNRSNHNDIVSVLCNATKEQINNYIAQNTVIGYLSELGWKPPFLTFHEADPDFCLFNQKSMDWDEDEIVDC